MHDHAITPKNSLDLYIGLYVSVEKQICVLSALCSTELLFRFHFFESFCQRVLIRINVVEYAVGFSGRLCRLNYALQDLWLPP
jgi:hypothetical protein